MSGNLQIAVCSAALTSGLVMVLVRKGRHVLSAQISLLHYATILLYYYPTILLSYYTTILLSYYATVYGCIELLFHAVNCCTVRMSPHLTVVLQQPLSCQLPPHLSSFPGFPGNFGDFDGVNYGVGWMIVKMVLLKVYLGHK